MKKFFSLILFSNIFSTNIYAYHPGGEPTKLWLLCHNIMHFLGDISGLGYEGANIFLFVFLQPALIILFMLLWLKEKFKK